MTARVSALALHPVKGTATRPVQAAVVRRWGLSGDRRWMVVDSQGVLVSARNDRRLLTLAADTPDTDATLHAPLRLRSRDKPEVGEVLVEEPATARVRVVLHGQPLTAVAAGSGAQRWLRAALGRDDATLVWCDDPEQRPLDPAYARRGDHTAFADGYPITAATTASLGRLQDWMTETALERGEPPPDPMPITRFRPNVVLDGDLTPFEEDRWSRVRVGEVALRVAKPVERCAVTTLDPETLKRGPEPIRTLARHRRWDGATWFAVHLVPDVTGVVRVGDPVVPVSG